MQFAMMQLKPVKGRYTFEMPVNAEYAFFFSLENRWDSFQVVLLEENHR